MNNFIEQVVKKYNRSDFKIIEYNGRTKKCIIKCLNCQNIFTIDRANRLLDKTRKNICPKCLIKKQPRQQQKSIEYQYKFNYWYDKMGNKKYIILDSYQYYSKPIKLQCRQCGAITSRNIESLLKKPQCLSCELKYNTKKTNQQFIKEVEELESQDYIFLEEYQDAHTKIKVRHKCGFIYETTPHNFLSRGRRCPKCGRFESKGENQINKILTRYKIKFEEQKRFDDFRKYTYDFFLSDLNIVIEYNGIQHYKPVDFFGGEKQLIKQKEIDKIKKEYAEKFYQFIVISYQEYDKIEEIIQTILSKFNDYPEKE